MKIQQSVGKSKIDIKDFLTNFFQYKLKLNVVKIYFYQGRNPNSEPFYDSLRGDGIQVRANFDFKNQSGTLVDPNNGLPYLPNQSVAIRVEAGVDVAIATKVLELSYNLSLDSNELNLEQVILITGDKDFNPCVEFAKLNKRNIAINVIGAKHSTSGHLLNFFFENPVKKPHLGEN